MHDASDFNAGVPKQSVALVTSGIRSKSTRSLSGVGWSSFPWFTNRARVPSATHAFQDTRVGEVAPSVAFDRGQMRVWRPERHFWKTQSRLSTFWPVEKACRTHTLARVCREAGATVTRNVKLRDMNVQVSATNEREIEVVAAGLPIHHGAQLAVDITQERSHFSRSTSGYCCHCQRSRTVVSSPGQRSQVRRVGGERTVPTGRGGAGDWWKVEHGGFGVRGRHGIFSRKGCTTGAATFSVSGVVEEVDKDVVNLVWAFATSLVVNHTDAWAWVGARSC